MLNDETTVYSRRRSSPCMVPSYTMIHSSSLQCREWENHYSGFQCLIRDANLLLVGCWIGRRDLLPYRAVDTAFLVVAGRCTSPSLAVLLVIFSSWYSMWKMHLSLLVVLRIVPLPSLTLLKDAPLLLSWCQEIPSPFFCNAERCTSPSLIVTWNASLPFLGMLRDFYLSIHQW